MPDTSSGTATHLQCLCASIHEPASLLQSSSLPIRTEICHCNPCRHTSGGLCPIFLRLTGPPTPTTLARCTLYNPLQARCERYFCSTCGARCFDHTTDTDRWFACSGLVEPGAVGHARNVVEVRCHKFLADTRDGGLAAVLGTLAGGPVPLFKGNSGQGAVEMTQAEVELLVGTKCQSREERLFVSCRCGGVMFYILPPGLAADQKRDMRVVRWLRADGQKYLALNCACQYCRRGSGCSFVTNAYVMPENIVAFNDPSVSLFDYTSRDERTSDFEASTELLRAKLPALRFDFSSPGIRRSWCGCCGASVFFERESRPQCVNVAVGILRAESGALAEQWIEFDWEVCWREQAVDDDLACALEAQRLSI